MNSFEKINIGENYKQYLERLTPEQLEMVRQQLEYTRMIYLSNVKSSNKRDALGEVYRAQQEMIDQTKEETALEITCRAGCAFCCYLHVDVNAHEAEVILEYCMEHDIAVDWTRLKKQSKKDYQTWGSLSMKNRRCVFLSDEDHCRIYEVRPSKCRLKLSADDPIKCADYDGEHLQWIANHAETVDVAIFNTVGGGTMAGELLKQKPLV